MSVDNMSDKSKIARLSIQMIENAHHAEHSPQVFAFACANCLCAYASILKDEHGNAGVGAVKQLQHELNTLFDMILAGEG